MNQNFIFQKTQPTNRTPDIDQKISQLETLKKEASELNKPDLVERYSELLEKEKQARDKLRKEHIENYKKQVKIR